jgi:formylmethanofuran dehydrogenase subunit E
MDSNFQDAVRRGEVPLNGRKPHALICPHCGEARLERLRRLASGVVFCLQCAAQFEVKE